MHKKYSSLNNLFMVLINLVKNLGLDHDYMELRESGNMTLLD